MSSVEPGSTGPEYDGGGAGGASGGTGGGGHERGQAVRHWGRLGGIGAALGMSLVFAVAAWYALQRSDMQDEVVAEIPLIKADTSAVKEKPKDPGGLKIPNQDKLVFERITPKPEAPAAEKLAPEPEEPIVKAAPVETTAAAPAVPSIASAEKMEEVVAPPPAAKAPVKSVAKPETSAAVEAHSAPPAITKKVVKAVNEIAVAAPKAAPKPASKTESLLPDVKVISKTKTVGAAKTSNTPKTPEATLPTPKVSPVRAPKIVKASPAKPKSPVKPTVAAKPAKSVNPAKKAAKGFRIQMASYRKPALANAAWRRLKRLHGSILGQLSGHTERADLGKRGVYYRVQAGIFGNAAGARAACTKLKAKKQDCIIVPPR